MPSYKNFSAGFIESNSIGQPVDLPNANFWLKIWLLPSGLKTAARISAAWLIIIGSVYLREFVVGSVPSSV